MAQSDRWAQISWLATGLQAAKVGYRFIANTALALQGVAIPIDQIDVEVQWDAMQAVHEQLAANHPTSIERDEQQASFTLHLQNTPVRVICIYNTVVEADPARVPVVYRDMTLWVMSLLFYRRWWPAADPRIPLINAALQREQARQTAHNHAAWSGATYAAWVARFGSPTEAAATIRANPSARLAPLGPYLGAVAGLHVLNLLGSHGSKAVALALLGATVTVVDSSAANAQYARELATAAGVPLHYLVADVLDLPQIAPELQGDVVFMELGILHYFIDLQPLALVIAHLLRPGGRLVLQDFHPVSTKLITSQGRKHKVTGNYFDTALSSSEVAWSKHGTASEAAHTLLRRWTLGEIVTAIADAGLVVRQLVEEPNTKRDDTGIPKTFTLVAEQPRGAMPPHTKGSNDD